MFGKKSSERKPHKRTGDPEKDERSRAGERSRDANARVIEAARAAALRDEEARAGERAEARAEAERAAAAAKTPAPGAAPEGEAAVSERDAQEAAGLGASAAAPSDGAVPGAGSAPADGAAPTAPSPADGGNARAGAPEGGGPRDEGGSGNAGAGEGPGESSDSDSGTIERRGKLAENALGDSYYRELYGRKQNVVSRTVSHWVDRVSGAAAEGSFANQEPEYESGRTTRDYICNTLGLSMWGLVFPLLTMVATQLVGSEQAGVFSLAFVTANLLMYIGDYGVRTFQVADTREVHSFADYQVCRFVTAGVMLAVAVLYCFLRGYTGGMLVMSLGVFAYRTIDTLGDVYEGRLQQSDKMYLGGLSQGLRSLVAFLAFSVGLFLTRTLAVACVCLAAGNLFVFLVLTLPLSYMETPRSRKVKASSVLDLLQRCFPLFSAIFLYNLCDNIPKFMMEGVLTYDNQLYFNAIYFPAHSILMISGMIYKPLLLRLAKAWNDPDGRKTFNSLMATVFGCIIGVVVFMLVVMNTIGLPLMSFLYGLDFEPFRAHLCLMIVAGGLTASIDFLYQVITIQRKQNTVLKLYVITFFVSVAASIVLINLLGLWGAVAAYVVDMAVLFTLILVQLARLRR